MLKKIIRSFLAVSILVMMMGVTVFGDEVSDLQREQDAILDDLDGAQREMAELLVQIDKIELQIAEKYQQLEAANGELAATQKDLDAQYDDMKLRIKYMYEDQSSNMMEVILASGNMSDVINRAEYIQQVYKYDRDKLEEISVTLSNIKNLKKSIQKDMTELERLAVSITEKKAKLETSISKLESQSDDYDKKIAAAVQKAAEAAAKNEGNNSNNGNTPPIHANNDSEVASAIVADSYKYLGVKYVYGGTSPSGFDCSGFTQYLFKQYGISLPRSAAGQLMSGEKVSSLSEAKPGDIICYPGHVALYIGDGNVIHAPYTGTVVRIQEVNMMTIVGIRRYW